ncbi:inositol monophosphatase family protein [Actinoplanes subglobosus]|uniref:Inositol monophosphatase family protein n=1 Tax=Actinoplanes subglobosus TaxID=1547892 RepID=A0ABV8J2G6_9ACTN
MSITDRDLAIAAASAGAAVVRARYESSLAGSALARFAKDGDDFATVADIEAEKAILDVLRTARPGDTILGEESGRTGIGDTTRMWLVDPLCGTLNYAANTMLTAVNVALRDNGRTIVAAVADPFNNEILWTDGDTARLRHSGVDRPLTPSGASRLVDLNLDPPFPNRPDFLAAALLSDDAFIDRFRPRVVSTTLAVAWVAAGRRAAYVTDGDLSDSVHFAAGIALCQAAGCIVTDLDGHPPHSGRGGLVAAADPSTHADLLAMIAGRSH